MLTMKPLICSLLLEVELYSMKLWRCLRGMPALYFFEFVKLVQGSQVTETLLHCHLVLIGRKLMS